MEKSVILKKNPWIFLFIIICIFFFSGCTTRNWFISSNNSTHVNGLQKKDVKEFMTTVQPVQGNAENQYRLARHFQEQGRHEIAVEEFIKALKIDPRHHNAYNALGVSYDHLKQHDLAIDAYTAALKINPDLGYVHNNIGYSYLLKGDLGAAEKSFETAIALNGRNRIYQNNLALVRAKAGSDMALVRAKAGSDMALTADTTDASKSKPIQPPGKEALYYAIQMGAYLDLDNAVRSLKNAQEKGYDCPYIIKIERGKSYKPYYRVRFGKYQSRSEAEAANITDNSGNPALIVAEIYPIAVFHAKADKQCSGINIEQVSLKENLKIEVLNGNGVYRMAARVSEYFTKKGLTVVHPANAAHFNYQATKIYYAPGHYQDARKLAQEIPGFEIAGKFIEAPDLNTDIRVLIGKDMTRFDEELKKGMKI